MEPYVDIGGRSRRFRIAVLIVAFVVVLTSVLLIGAIEDEDTGEAGIYVPDVNHDPIYDSERPGDGEEEEGEPSDDGEPQTDENEDSQTDENEDSQTDENEDSQTDEDQPGPPYNITVIPDPEPGIEVTVSVTKNNTSISAASVEFNNEPIGETNVTGQVTAEVPYTDSLIISVTPPPNAGSTSHAETEDNDEGLSHQASNQEGQFVSEYTVYKGSSGVHAVPLLSEDSISSENGDEMGDQTDARGRVQATNDSEDEADTDSVKTFALPTNVSVEYEDMLIPGSEVTTTYAINGTAVPDADVYIEDEYIGMTNSDGQLTAHLPDDIQFDERVTVRVERDDLVSTTAIRTAIAEIRVETGLMATPVSTAEVTVVATQHGETKPLDHASISTFSGETPTERDRIADNIQLSENASASVTLPWSNELTITASVASGQEITRTVTGLYYPLAAAVLALLLIPVGVVVLWRRRTGLPRLPKPTTQSPSKPAVSKLTTGFYTALFRLAAVLHRVGTGITAFKTRLVNTFTHIIAPGKNTLSTIDLKRGPTIIRNLPRIIARWLYALVANVIGIIYRLFDSADDTLRENPPQTTGKKPATDLATLSAYERIRACWRWLFKAVIGRSNQNTQTTVEIANTAVSYGFPQEPIQRLRTAYQDVEYGSRDAETRVGTAEDAVEYLQRTTSEDSE